MRSMHDGATGEQRDCISRDVVTLVERLGAAPVLVPNGLKDPAGFIGRMGADALLLTGGNDLCAVTESSGCAAGGSADLVRDETERALLSCAIDAQLPVFGICRGLQLIARFFGAPVERIAPRGAHAGAPHALEIVREQLEEMIGVCEAERVLSRRSVTNSFHDFGVRVDALPAELLLLARSPDGFVEALRHRSLPIVAVCWHPEREGSMTALDEALLQAWLAWCTAAPARALR